MNERLEVLLLIPERYWSSGGHVKTINRPLRVQEVKLADGTTAFAIDGAPSDCVAFRALGVMTEKFDLVVSGINPMPNPGHDVTYSGTVTTAMETVVWGIPTVAFSLDSPENNSGLHGYCAAAKAAGGVIHQVLERGIPPSDLLNMNVYLRPWNDIKGFAFIATTWKSVLTQAGVHFIGSAMKLPGASWNKGLKLVLLPMGRYQRLPCNQI